MLFLKNYLDRESTKRLKKILHKAYECNIFVTFSWHSVTVGVYLYSQATKSGKKRSIDMRKIRLIAEAVCLITSMTITPVVTSVEKNDSMVVETVAEASQTPVLKSANVIPITIRRYY